MCVTQDDWTRLCAYLGNPEWTASPLFADRLMRAFLPLAFRRPVTKVLEDYYVKLVHAALDFAPVRRARYLLPTMRDANLPLVRREIETNIQLKAAGIKVN